MEEHHLELTSNLGRLIWMDSSKMKPEKWINEVLRRATTACSCSTHACAWKPKIQSLREIPKSISSHRYPISIYIHINNAALEFCLSTDVFRKPAKDFLTRKAGMLPSIAGLTGSEVDDRPKMAWSSL